MNPRRSFVAVAMAVSESPLLARYEALTVYIWRLSGQEDGHREVDWTGDAAQDLRALLAEMHRAGVRPQPLRPRAMMALPRPRMRVDPADRATWEHLTDELLFRAMVRNGGGWAGSPPELEARVNALEDLFLQ